jgi:hypothetical protein
MNFFKKYHIICDLKILLKLVRKNCIILYWMLQLLGGGKIK